MSLVLNTDKNILNTDKKIIAYIVNKNSNKKINTISLDENDNVNGNNEIILDNDCKLQLAPVIGKEDKTYDKRTVLFIAGMSGSGKSYFAREYCKFYNKIHPKNPIYLI